jgi:hypothetical protein
MSDVALNNMGIGDPVNVHWHKGNLVQVVDKPVCLVHAGLAYKRTVPNPRIPAENGTWTHGRF